MRRPDDIQDELLVIRGQSGEADALALLVQRWQPRLLAHASRLTGDRQAAADAVQEAWLSIVRGLSRLDDPARFRPWAYRIVRNKCVDWTRRQVRQRGISTSLATDPVDGRPARGVEADEEVTTLRSALRQLPADRRAILAMCYIDEMPLRQIAEVLDVPVGTVKSRLYHARAELKEVLERSER